MNAKFQSSLPEHVWSENILCPRSQELRFELRAAHEVLERFKTQLGNDLRKQLHTDDRAIIELALDDWFHLAFLADGSALDGEPVEYHEVLEQMRPVYAAIAELPPDSTWNRIYCAALETFDDAIETGLEAGWSWERISDVRWGSEQIGLALRYGADPEIRFEVLLDLIREEGWWAVQEGRDRQIRSEHTYAEARRLYGLPDDASPDEIVERMFQIMRRHLSQLWGREASEISEQEIMDFLNSL